MYLLIDLSCTHIYSAGLPGAVTSLKSESLGPVIHLTWDAPFSLDITGVDPDIWYRVDITVTNTSLNNYSISTLVYVPEFNFTMDDYNGTNTSVLYQFRVTPVNGAGNGTASAPVTGYFSGREFSVWRKLTKENLYEILRLRALLSYT